MAVTQQELETLMDERAIDRLLALYCRAADRGDYGLMRTLFHDDAQFDFGHFRGGLDAFLGHVSHFPPFAASQHHVTNRLIEIEGDRAEAEIYCIALLAGLEPDGARSDATAFLRYLTRFERRDGEWLISRHVVVWDWNQNAASTVSWKGVRDDDTAIRSVRGREDASYQELPMIGRW